MCDKSMSDVCGMIWECMRNVWLIYEGYKVMYEICTAYAYYIGRICTND